MATKGQTKSRLQRELRNAYRLLRKTGQQVTDKVRSTDKYNDLRSRLKEVRPQLQTEAVKEIQRREREARRESTGKRRYAREYETRRQALSEAGVPAENIPHALPQNLKKFRAQDIKRMSEALTIENVTQMEQVTPTQSVSKAMKEVAQAQLESVRAYADSESKRRLSTETTLHGEQTGLTRGEMGDLRQMSHAPTGEFRGDRGFADWNKHFEAIESYLGRDDAETYKESYIMALLHEYGTRAYDLIYDIEQVSAEKLLSWYYQEEDVDVDYFYAMDASDDALTHLTETYRTLGLKPAKNKKFDEAFYERQQARVESMSNREKKR